MKCFESIEEIMKDCKSTFQMLIKFGNRKNMESLQCGNVYMKNIEFFNKLEQKNDSGKPDKNDAKWAVKDLSFTLYDIETHEPVCKGETGAAVFSFGYDKYPIFCMFSFDYRNCGEYTNDESSHVCTFPVSFTEEQKKKIKNGLGEYALIITNTDEFLNRLTNALRNNGYEYRFKIVEYNDGNSIDRIHSVQDGIEGIVFCKGTEFAYQQEWRLLITNQKVDDHLSVDIGDISDISVLWATEDLLNKYQIMLTQHYSPISRNTEDSSLY